MEEEAEDVGDAISSSDLPAHDELDASTPPSTPPTGDSPSSSSLSSLTKVPVIDSTPIPTVHLRKALGWRELVSLGVGCTIGAGIFVVTGKVAREQTGPALFLSYIISGLACLCSAFCYAEFAAMSPSAGSAYSYARATMGELMGWIIGWDLTLEYAVSASAVAKGWSEHFNEVLTLLGIPLPPLLTTAPLSSSWGLSGGLIDLPAVLITIIVTLILLRGIKESAVFNHVMVAVKVTIVLFVIVVGAFYVKASNFSPFMPFGFAGISLFGTTVFGQTNENGDAVGVLAGSALVFFAYIGFDAVSCQAEECKRPQIDLPIGIIGSLAISTVLYVAVSLVLVGMVPYTSIDPGAPFSKAFRDLGLAWAEGIVTLGALTGITSVLLVTLLGQPRITLAMARDGLLPPSFFAYIHPVYKTPYYATCLTGVLVAVTSGLIPLSILVELVSIGTLFAFTLVCCCVLILRHTRPDAPRPFRVPYSPYIPALGAVMCGLLMLSLPSSNWVRLLVWLGVGLVVYYLYGRRRGVRMGVAYHLGRVTEEGEEEVEGEEGGVEEGEVVGGSEEDGGDGVGVKKELRSVSRIVKAAVVEMTELVRAKGRRQHVRLPGTDEETDSRGEVDSVTLTQGVHELTDKVERGEEEVKRREAESDTTAAVPVVTSIAVDVGRQADTPPPETEVVEVADVHERALPPQLLPRRTRERKSNGQQQR